MLRGWRMNLCLNWQLKRRNANWIRRKVRQPLLPSSILSPLLQFRLSRWWRSHLPLLVPKGKVRLGKESGRTQPQLSAGLTMWLLIRILRGCLPSHLMSWSVVTYISWCRYYTCFFTIKFFYSAHEVWLCDPLPGSWRVTASSNWLSTH